MSQHQPLTTDYFNSDLFGLSFKITPDPDILGGYPQTTYSLFYQITAQNNTIETEIINNNFSIAYYLDQINIGLYETTKFLISGELSISSVEMFGQYFLLDTFSNLQGDITGNIQLAHTNPYWILNIENSLFLESSSYLFDDYKTSETSYRYHIQDAADLVIEYNNGWDITYTFLSSYANLSSEIIDRSGNILTFLDDIKINAVFTDDPLSSILISKSKEYLRPILPELSATLINITQPTMSTINNVLSAQQNDEISLHGIGVNYKRSTEDIYITKGNILNL